MCIFCFSRSLECIYQRTCFLWHRKQERLCNDKIELQLLGGFCGKIPFNFKKLVILGVFIFRLWCVSASLSALWPQHLRFPSVARACACAHSPLCSLHVVSSLSQALVFQIIGIFCSNIPRLHQFLLKASKRGRQHLPLVFINFIIRV